MSRDAELMKPMGTVRIAATVVTNALSAGQHAMLLQIAQTGVFGSNITEVADYLIKSGLDGMIQKGIVEKINRARSTK